MTKTGEEDPPPHPRLYTPDQRRLLTAMAIQERRTLTEVWTPYANSEEGLGDAEPMLPTWEARAVLAAEVIGHAKSVIDIGCLAMTLELLLVPGVKYIPCDIMPRDDRTIVVDMNKADPPLVDAEVVVMLGVLEYIFDVPAVLRKLAGHYLRGIISYTPHKGIKNYANRRSLFWVNEYTENEFTDLLGNAGWHIISAHTIGRQIVWNLIGRRQT